MTSDECARIEELISAQQDGAANPEERAAIERHVAGCARCQATVAAYGQVDRQVRRYLMTTPVPEIAAPWRKEPLLLPAQRGGGLSHWRVTAVGLAAVFIMIFTASILAFQPFRTAEPQTAGGRPAAELVSGSAAPGSAAQVAATSTPSTAFVAPAAPQQPQPTAASAAVRSAATPASGAATRAAAAAGAAATSTRAAAPVAGAVADTPINPAQQLRLGEATELTICRPDAGWCDTQPRTAAERAAIVAALDQPLPRLAPSPVTGSDQYVILKFRFTSGEERTLSYHVPTRRLSVLGNIDVQGSTELANILAGVVAPR